MGSQESSKPEKEQKQWNKETCIPHQGEYIHIDKYGNPCISSGVMMHRKRNQNHKHIFLFLNQNNNN